MPVNTERDDYKEMKPRWQRVRDCEGGRDAVLAAGELYVPSLPAKNAEENVAYRARGSFYNALLRTIQGMVGAIFQEAPEVEFPTTFKTYLDDITLTNIPFEMFAQTTGREVMIVGRYGILVDMPLDPSPDARPYCIGYKAEDIINWRTTRIAGAEVLTMIVLRETVEELDPKDPFITPCVMQYRVVQLIGAACITQLWREDKDKKNEYVQYGAATVSMRRGTALDFIPFVFICATAATPELEPPPFIDLADVNLGHWRNSCDYEYGLHLVALPTPWVSGARNAEQGTPMKIGPSVVWELDASGSAGMLEFSGSGLGAIMSAMDEKKKQMAVLGARMLEDVPSVNETASAVKMRHSGEHASLRTVTQSIELGLTMILQIVVWWKGTDAKPVDVKVDVELNKEYNTIKLSAQEMTAALQALQADEISFETWYNILVTGGWAREGVTPENELKSIEKRISDKKAREPKPDPAIVPPARPKLIKRTAEGYRIEEENA